MSLSFLAIQVPRGLKSLWLYPENTVLSLKIYLNFVFYIFSITILHYIYKKKKKLVNHRYDKTLILESECSETISFT